MTQFQLDPILERDTANVGALPLCRVLLMRDSRYAWLILVPARPGLVELGDLEAADRSILMEELIAAGDALTALYEPEKINTGALGNAVRQLHIHVVARNTGDPAWPGPVWGHSPAEPYDAANLETRLTALRRHLNTA